MPLVPAVTELVIAELLYLNYEDQSKPVTMYINSSGTTTATGQAVGFETEAFAIADVMRYIRPPVNTVAIGQAFGAAAMILSMGVKGGRAALPNATIRLNQPKSQAQRQASDIAIRAREVAQKINFFQKLFLSGQTYSYRSEYDILQVWLNIIDHNMCIKGVKATFFSLVVGFAVGE